MQVVSDFISSFSKMCEYMSMCLCALMIFTMTEMLSTISYVIKEKLLLSNLNAIRKEGLSTQAFIL